MQGIVVAGTHSGCGKTTVVLGLLAALVKKGVRVQAFKTGPDFIDAGLHRAITGNPSRNLDLWMCGEEYVKNTFLKRAAYADFSLVEGVMGMYDGSRSTADLAAVLGLPVVLVVDAYGMAESAGAVVKGFTTYSAEARKLGRSEGTEEEVSSPSALPRFRASALITGVIFNRVASERHYQRLRESVVGVPVLGYLPRDLDFEIPHRHLGLIVAEENPIAQESIDRLADSVLRHVDVKALLKGAQSPLPSPSPLKGEGSSFAPFPLGERVRVRGGCRIAVAYDKAFCFYYQDNLELLQEAGAELLFFSPLSDHSLPENTDALYIGGGYPELYAEALSQNTSMITAIKKSVDTGMPIYAECGGLMYLSEGIFDFDKRLHPMAGVFPFKTTMRKKSMRLGYREVTLAEDCILGAQGSTCRGHEFHYSDIEESNQVKTGTVPDLRTERSGVVESGLSLVGHIYSVRNNQGEHMSTSGYTYRHCLASYIHIHFGSNSEIAVRFIEFIKEHQWKPSYS